MTQTCNDRTAMPSDCCRDVSELFEPRFFKALCDPNRLTLLTRLAHSCQPRSVSEISSCCPVDISVVSRHLAMLRDAGILEAEKRGKEVFYAFPYKKLAATLREIADAIEACCKAQKSRNKKKGKRQK